MDEGDLLLSDEVDAVLGQLGPDADWRLVVDEEPVHHRLPIGIAEHGLAEYLDGVQRRRGGQTDLGRIEIVQHATVFGDVVVLVAEAEFGIRHLAVEQVAPVALVDDHEVVLIDGRRVRRVGGEQGAAHEALDGADVDAGLGVRRHITQGLEAENLGESLPGHDLGCRELPLRLVPEGAAVDDEADAPEAFRGDQAIQHGDGQLGLASPGRHADEHLRPTLGEPLLDGLDSLPLVGAKVEAEVEPLGLQGGLSGLLVGLQALQQTFRAWPTHQGGRAIGRASQVPPPDTRGGLKLLQIGATVGREGEGSVEHPPRRLWVQMGVSGSDALRVPLGLRQDAHDVAVTALGLHHAHQCQTGEQSVVGRAARGRPFGDGQVAPFGRPRALGVAELAGVRFPTGSLELLVDDGPRRRLVEVDGGVRNLGGLLQLGELSRGRFLGEALGGLKGRPDLTCGRFGLLRQLLPDPPLLGLPAETLGRLQILQRQGLGASLRDLGGAAMGFRLRPELIQLVTQTGSWIGRRGRGRKRPQGQIGRPAVAPDKPAGQLAGDLQSPKGRREIIEVAVDRVVPRLAQIVEQVERLTGGVAGTSEHPEDIGEGLVGRPQRAGPRGDLLGQQLGELPQLDQGGVGIGAEVVLRLGSQPNELLPLRAQELEVGAGWLHQGPRYTSAETRDRRNQRLRSSGQRFVLLTLKKAGGSTAGPDPYGF